MIAVVFVPELSGTSLCGAARWIASDKALLQLSLRYKTDDHLWFAFFHELGHILLHGKRDFFVDTETDMKDDKEKEADAFSCDMLIPPKDYQSFVRKREFTSSSIQDFASQLGITPGIVVGRLQHDCHLKWSELNYLKTLSLRERE